MKLPENFKITGPVDNIYWQFKDSSDTCVIAGKKTTLFGCTGLLLFISIVLVPAFTFSSPAEDMAYVGLVYFIMIMAAITMIVMAIIKNKERQVTKKELHDIIQGIIEGVRDDIRHKVPVSLSCELTPTNKPIESDEPATEPNFSSVRRIKYKYKIADLKFTMIDGNILKIRIYTKEREKIKVDHTTKREFRKRFVLKIRLDINQKCYDIAGFNEGVYNNYELTPNIVIAGMKKGQSHISMKALLSKLDQYSGRQIAGMIKGMYSGVKLKRFSQV